MLANVAIPSFLPHSLATLVGIFLIAAIEGWFLARCLKLTYSQSYSHALSANLLSTFAGIPVAWLLWLGGLIPLSYGLAALGFQSHPAIQATLVQTAANGGIMPTEWTNVGSAAAWIVMLVPFWMGSVWIERRTIMRRDPYLNRSLVFQAVARGNLASYSLFLILGVIALSSALADLPNQKARHAKWREHRERQKMEKRVSEMLPTQVGG